MSTSAASRPSSSRINVHESSEYPIVLGESLKKSAAATQAKLLRVRYNWEPQRGFSSQTGTLRQANGLLRLAYTDDQSGSSTYEYNSSTAKDVDSDDGEQSNNLALIYDPAKAAFVLEQISHSFDFNLASAHDQSRDRIKQHKKINATPPEGRTNGADLSADNDDEEADATNPFDFRHFLSEAKENAEKASQPIGGRTPIPGSRTPLSGISSPSLVAGRFPSTSTPQFRPTPTSAPLPKKSTLSRPAASATTKKQTTTKRKPATKPPTSQPKSSELVFDSSDEDEDESTIVSRPSSSRNQDQKHSRNPSSISLAKSPPRDAVDNGGLEIVMGSPQHEPSRRAVLDLEAFRSQTHTPSLPSGHGRAMAPSSDRDVEMQDQSEDDDDRANAHESDHDSLREIDDDVEELALDSPVSRKSEGRRGGVEKIPSPPTPLAPPTLEDDEDFLAAELEKELGYDDEESEVSEEE